MPIHILSPADQRVRRFLDSFFDGTFPQLVVAGATLFGGDRIECVEAAALLEENGVAIGLATLAPTDEMGLNGPTIIALWTEPEARALPSYRKLAVALFRALVEESKRRYGAKPRFVPVTQTEQFVAQQAQEEGVDFIYVPVKGQLPGW